MYCVLGAVGCVLYDVRFMLLVRARSIDCGSTWKLCIKQGCCSRSGWVRELVHVLTRALIPDSRIDALIKRGNL
jgi:hypothetical protein